MVLNNDSTAVPNDKGVPVFKRHRIYYEAKAKAEADRSHIETQDSTTGTNEYTFAPKSGVDCEQLVQWVEEFITERRTLFLNS